MNETEKLLRAMLDLIRAGEYLAADEVRAAIVRRLVAA